MKLRHLFFALVAGAAALAACEQLPEDLGAPVIRIEPSSLDFAATAGDKDIAITATLNWSIKGDLPDWISLSATEGKASAEKQTVTVSVEANDSFNRSHDIVFSIGMSSATLTINQDGAKGTFEAVQGDGTQNSPFNVAQIAAAVSSLTWENQTTYEKLGPYYVRGMVASIKEAFSSAYGNGHFVISDDGTSSGAQFTAYRIYYLQNKKWVEGNKQVEVGDVVVVYGEVMNYQNNTPETVQKGSYLYSLNDETVATGAVEIDYSTVEAKTVAEFIELKDTKTPYKLTGEVTGTIYAQSGSFDLKDDTGTIAVYMVENWADWQDKVAKGTTITIAGVFKDYNGKAELVNGHILSAEGGNIQTEITESTVADFIAKNDGLYYRLTGKVSGFQLTSSNGKNYMQFYLTDNTGSILAYGFKDGQYDVWSNVIKDYGTVTLTGVYQYYEKNKTHEIINITVETFEPGEAPTEFEDLTVEEFIGKADVANFYRLSGIVTDFAITDQEKGFLTFNLKDDTGSILVYSLKDGQFAEWSSKLSEGGNIVLVGQYKTYNNTPEVVNATIESFEANANYKYCKVTPDALNVKANATSATIQIKSNAAWEVASDNGDFVVSPASGEGDAEVTITFTANESEEEARVANINVVCAAANFQTVVVLTQAKAAAAGANVVEIVIEDYATANNWANGTKYTTIEKDGVTLTATGGSNTGKFYDNGKEWRFYQTESPKLTISVADGELSSAELTYNVANTGVLIGPDGAQLPSGSEVALSGTSAEFTVGNTGSANNGQVKFTKIVVTFNK